MKNISMIFMSLYGLLMPPLIAEAQAVSIEYEYDVHGRLIEVDDSANGLREYEFDYASNRTGVTVSSGGGASGGNHTCLNRTILADPQENITLWMGYWIADPDPNDTHSFVSYSTGTLVYGNVEGIRVQSPPNLQTLNVTATIEDQNGAQITCVTSVFSDG